ncbi:cupin domain-containing protein [Acidicapsa acidisoli]|uniref:cupin domain-containing protein n=1 Tax=Acidicapsa acidisoli TaxID=1615681 RepID=UPI0021E07A5F|nr:cupin domain-containing protein [Acidicapsa acidisoli]
MMQDKEHLSPAAFSRATNVDSTFAYMGSLMTFLAKGSETSGRFALMVYHTKPGNEPPPHVHEREHELYFVLEGAMRFYCEDKTLDIGSGDVVFLPQGKAHAFTCISDVVRTLIFVQAADNDAVGLDSYFLAMGRPAGSMALPESAITYAVDEPEHAIRVGASTGIRILSPSEAQQALPQFSGFGVPVR